MPRVILRGSQLLMMLMDFHGTWGLKGLNGNPTQGLWPVGLHEERVAGAWIWVKPFLLTEQLCTWQEYSSG